MYLSVLLGRIYAFAAGDESGPVSDSDGDVRRRQRRTLVCAKTAYQSRSAGMCACSQTVHVLHLQDMPLVVSASLLLTPLREATLLPATSGTTKLEYARKPGVTSKAVSLLLWAG